MTRNARWHVPGASNQLRVSDINETLIARSRSRTSRATSSISLPPRRRFARSSTSPTTTTPWSPCRCRTCSASIGHRRDFLDSRHQQTSTCCCATRPRSVRCSKYRRSRRPSTRSKNSASSRCHARTRGCRRPHGHRRRNRAAHEVEHVIDQNGAGDMSPPVSSTARARCRSRRVRPNWVAVRGGDHLAPRRSTGERSRGAGDRGGTAVVDACASRMASSSRVWIVSHFTHAIAMGMHASSINASPPIHMIAPPKWMLERIPAVVDPRGAIAA